jgi:hypothetical protein
MTGTLTFNARPANVFRNGNYAEYTAFMLRKYGPGIIDELLKRKRAVVKYTIPDLQNMIEAYERKLIAL